MPPPPPPIELSAEQLELWQHVEALWALSASRDEQRIRDALHPDYMGWDMNSPLPHDRDAALRSVAGDTPRLAGYELQALSVRVYEGTVGVVHYRYAATVEPTGVQTTHVAGRWTEVYAKRGSRWLMVAVSGRPDPAVIVRPERAGDEAAVRSVHLAAFETAAEADLVDALREQARPLVSLVGEVAGEIVGHVMFSPVTFDGQPDRHLMGLAPLAVAPAHQRQGVGSALVRAGLDRCTEIGAGAVVVLGHPSYYPRFGFRPATGYGIRSDFEAPAEAFMLVELQPGHLSQASGTVRFHPAFRGV